MKEIKKLIAYRIFVETSSEPVSEGICGFSTCDDGTLPSEDSIASQLVLAAIQRNQIDPIKAELAAVEMTWVQDDDPILENIMAIVQEQVPECIEYYSNGLRMNTIKPKPNDFDEAQFLKDCGVTLN